MPRRGKYVIVIVSVCYLAYCVIILFSWREVFGVKVVVMSVRHGREETDSVTRIE